MVVQEGMVELPDRVRQVELEEQVEHQELVELLILEGL